MKRRRKWSRREWRKEAADNDEEEGAVCVESVAEVVVEKVVPVTVKVGVEVLEVVVYSHMYMYNRMNSSGSRSSIGKSYQKRK